MFEKYLIGEGSLKNVVRDGSITGFQVDVRIGYYRHLGLSMVEGFDITVDGFSYPREKNLFTVRGRTYTTEQMEIEYDNSWEFGEFATVTVPKEGGLAPGAHQVDLVEHLRVSYMPVATCPRTKREMTLAA
jgi:hypothetical protein